MLKEKFCVRPNLPERPIGWDRRRNATRFMLVGLLAAMVSLSAAPDSAGRETPRLTIRWLLADPSLGRAGQIDTISAFVGSESGPANVSPHLILPPHVRLFSSGGPETLRLADAGGQKLWWKVIADRETVGNAVLRLGVSGAPVTSAALPLHFLAPVRRQKLACIPAPRPVKTTMLIGALDCPLWEKNNFSAWDQVLRHPERTPALGFYAQENSQIADWETKWAVEHGISFFTYCWYRTSQGGPVTTAYSSAIDKALFHSRFANKFKFSIMWENSARGTAGVADEHDLTTNLLPYWMNRYFKNPGYLKIDNKPVLFIYRPELLAQDLGGVAKVKTAFDKMRQACRDAGFAGMYILGEYRGLDPVQLTLLKQLGLDASFAYVWGIPNNPTPQQAVDAQLGYLQQTRRLGILPLVATVSQGWSGWHDEGSVWRLPPTDYEQLLRRTKAFAASLPAGSLGSRMLLLDNWNEYGEGHYIAPHTQYGFGYLDAVRTVFSGGEEPHQDLLPQDVGLGPYDTVFRRHLERQSELRQLCLRKVTRAGAAEPGLIGWWSFDEDAHSPVAFDDSGHRLGGEMLAERAPGRSGRALVCRGGCVLAPASTLLNPTAGITLECWVKTNASGQDNKWFLNHVFAGATDTGYRMGVLDGRPCFEVPFTAWSHHLEADMPLPTGRWVYLAGVFDGRVMKIYVDGSLHGVMDRPGPVKPNTFPLCLGNYDVNHPAHFTGLLDEVKIYNRALSPDEIADHYARVLTK